MKKLSLLLLLLITVFFADAQKKHIDTLRVALSKAKTDTMRFEALYNLGFAYYFPNPDSAILFQQQAYLLAKKNNWALNQVKCLVSMGAVYTNLGDYVKGLQVHFKVLKIAGELNNLYAMSVANNNISGIYVQQQDYKKALPYLRLSLKQFNTFALSNKLLFKHKRYRAIVYDNIGECYLYMHRTDSAAYYLNICYDDCKKLNLTDVINVVQDNPATGSSSSNVILKNSFIQLVCW